MNKLIVLGAAALTLLAVLPEEAFAQRAGECGATIKVRIQRQSG